MITNNLIATMKRNSKYAHPIERKSLVEDFRISAAEPASEYLGVTTQRAKPLL